MKTTVVLFDRITKQPFKRGTTDLTFREVVADSLNMPPLAYAQANGGASGENPKHKAELRAGIIEKILDADEVELLPEQVEEILYCVSSVQPTTVFLSVKNVINGVDQQGK